MEDFKVYQASGYLTKLVTDASDVRKTYEEISGSLVEFDTPISAPLAELIVDINPVQDLHGQDAPYPAGGGKNILDPNIKFTAGTYYGGMVLSTTDGYNFTATGTPTESGNVTTNSIPTDEAIVLPAGTYTSTGAIFSTYKPDGSWYGNRQSGTWTADEDFIIRQAYIQAVAGQPASINRFIALAKGSTAPTAWSPFSNICPITGWTGANIYHSGEDTSDPTTYTISWQDDAGTVYGGTVDLVSGVLTVDRIKHSPTSCHSFSSTNTYGNIRVIGNSLKKTATNNISDTLKFVLASGSGLHDNQFSVNGGAAEYYFVKVAGCTTKAELDSWLSTNKPEFVLELAEPTEIQLTPQEINTLIGVNNIWADTGDVSVKYRTH